LSVQGCQNATVGNIVRGTYSQYSENHQQAVYRRSEQVNGLDVLVYYWDDRDGPNFCGWWFGPKVGGDQVWAYNSERSMTPPSTGWRVPYDGPVDGTFSVNVSGADGGASPQQQAYAQQQHAQQQQQQQLLQQQQMQQQQQQQQQWAQQQQEEKMRQQQQEQQRQQMEAQRRQQMEELQRRKREEEARTRLEQHAALTARKSINDLRAATPENFAELCQKVQEVLGQELPRCGSMAQRCQQDAAEQIEQARQRCEAVQEQRKRDEERKVEETQAFEEQQEGHKKQLGELVGLVEKAEATCGKLKEAAAPLEGGAFTAAQAADLQKVVNAAGAETKVACKEALDFVLAQRQRLEPASALLLSTQAEEVKKFVDDAREELLNLQKRIAECLTLAITSSVAAKAAGDKAVKRDTASRRMDKRGAGFDKYDKNRDGFLNEKELTEYAKGEFGFAVPKDGAAKIMALLAEAKKGVPKAKFHDLKVAVGVMREEEASKDRIKKAQERKKFIEDKKAAYTADVGKVAESIEEVDKEVKKAEEKAVPLKAEEITKLSAADLSQALTSAQEQLTATKDEIESVRKQIKDLDQDLLVELASFVRLECRKLEVKLDLFAPRLAQVNLAYEKGKSHLVRQEQRELEMLRSEAAKAVKAFATEKKLSQDDLIKAMDKDGDGSVSKGDFTAFLEGCDGLKLEGSQVDKLYALLDESNTGAIPQDTLLCFIRVYYRVIQDTVITTEQSIKGSKTVRRLEVDEIVEALEGPVEEEDVKIKRIRASALRDSSEGWITVMGNNDTVFLEEHPPLFRLVAAAPLTKEIEATSEAIKALPIGEPVEVLDWDKKDEAGHSRLRVRTRGGAGGGEERVTGWLAGPAGGEAAILKLEPRTS